MDLKYAGVDWLTMTTRDERVGAQWYQTYQKYKGVRRREGNEEKEFHNGFYGGVRIANMSVGHSDALGYIIVVSGGDAERLFQRLQPGKHRVTRIDLCMDFLLKRPSDVADQLFAGMSHNNQNKQRKFSLFKNSEGGKTFYLGSRQSTQFGRVYDKGIQSGREKAGLYWRAEVEYKKPLAGEISNSLAAIDPEGRGRAICGEISGWFATRGLEVFPAGDYPSPLHISVEQRITTADRKLAWLRSQVSPSVDTLISAGYGKNVLKALGLDIPTISQCLKEKA